MFFLKIIFSSFFGNRRDRKGKERVRGNEVNKDRKSTKRVNEKETKIRSKERGRVKTGII